MLPYPHIWYHDASSVGPVKVIVIFYVYILCNTILHYPPWNQMQKPDELYPPRCLTEVVCRSRLLPRKGILFTSDLLSLDRISRGRQIHSRNSGLLDLVLVQKPSSFDRRLETKAVPLRSNIDLRDDFKTGLIDA